MGNGRNGVDTSVVPQGMVRQMMPMPLDVSGMPLSPVDAARSGPVSMPTLASALAAASPESQRMVYCVTVDI